MEPKIVNIAPVALPTAPGEPKFDALPKEIPECEVPPLTVASPEVAAAYVRYIQPYRAELVAETDTWRYVENTSAPTIPAMPILRGEHFVDTDDGLHTLKGGEQGSRVTNAASLRIDRILEHWISEHSCRTTYVCALKCPEAWGEEERFIEIPKEQFKNAFRFIKKEYPAIFLHQEDASIEEYLTKVFQRDEGNAPREPHVMRMGWMRICGCVRYWPGEDSFYADHALPMEFPIDRRTVFERGVAFRRIGHGNAQVDVIWLFSHLPYLLFWLQQANADAGRMVLYIYGATNLFKTSVIAILSDVFRKNRKKAVIRLKDSTAAGIQESMTRLADNLLCLDDFFRHGETNDASARKNAEAAIRAVGDGLFPSKMSVKDFSQLRQDEVRCALVMTGECELGLGQSSAYRMLQVPVEQGTFNPNELRAFQDDPQILRDYFGLFIRFLAEHGERIAEESKVRFPELRYRWREDISVPRLVDAAATLSLIGEIIDGFASYCGYRINYCERAAEAIRAIVKSTERAGKTAAPEIRFLYALRQSIGSDQNNSLASNEAAYAENEARYIGFREDAAGLTWLRFDDVYRLAERYYRKLGETWAFPQDALKKALLRQGISDGKLVPEGQGGNEYLRRARKGSRKRMLVLKDAEVEKVLKNFEEEL